MSKNMVSNCAQILLPHSLCVYVPVACYKHIVIINLVLPNGRMNFRQTRNYQHHKHYCCNSSSMTLFHTNDFRIFTPCQLYLNNISNLRFIPIYTLLFKTASGIGSPYLVHRQTTKTLKEQVYQRKFYKGAPYYACSRVYFVVYLQE